MIHLEMSDLALRPTRIRAGATVQSCGSSAERRPFGRPRTYLRLHSRARRFIKPLALILFGAALGACAVSRSVLAPVRSVPTAAARPVGVEAAHPSARWITVRPGDTIWSLAERFGPADRPLGDSVVDLIRWNGLGASAALRPGQRIRVAE